LLSEFNHGYRHLNNPESSNERILWPDPLCTPAYSM
jgi:hypothetical protein